MQILSIDDKSDGFTVKIDVEPYTVKFPPRPKDKNANEYAAEQLREYMQKPADKPPTTETEENQ